MMLARPSSLVPVMLVVLPVVVGGAAGCGGGPENAFIGTRALDTCDEELPVCNATAGCKLVEEESYLEGSFPGTRSFVVPTDGEALIRVSIYWRTQLGPGADTEIIWNEPSCVDRVRYESQGADVFADSDVDRVFTKEETVFRGGEHLVIVRSDAVADWLLRTEVLTPDEVAREQQDRVNPGIF